MTVFVNLSMFIKIIITVLVTSYLQLNNVVNINTYAGNKQGARHVAIQLAVRLNKRR